MLMRLVPLSLALALVGCKSAPKAIGPSETFSQDGYEITITEVETPKNVLSALESREAEMMAEALPPRGEEAIGLVEIATIINLGKQVWDIVSANKAVSNIAVDWASATPKGIADVSELAGFSNMVSKSYNLDVKNVLGIKAFSMVYTVVHQYGGSYEGKGKYLANVSIVPSKVDTAWSYTSDVKTVKIHTVNVGTDEAPVASLAMSMHVKLQGATKSREFTRVVQFRGDTAAVTHVQ